ncbi:MAG TPA: tetratricopeptide repeat protein [Ktedonobacteraceae bacterium]|nr:tetratricopeptide repeat protein [Ktedonobacteraceae bacterium]
METLYWPQIVKGLKLLFRGIRWLYNNPLFQKKVNKIIERATSETAQAKYAILYFEDNNLNQKTAKLTQSILKELYDTEPKLIPWVVPNDFRDVWDLVKGAQHSLILVTHELHLFPIHKEGEQNQEQETLIDEIASIAAKQTPSHSSANESQGTLIFLQDDLFDHFRHQAADQGKRLSLLKLSLDETTDRRLIEAQIPYNHCQPKSPQAPTPGDHNQPESPSEQEEKAEEVAQTPQKNLRKFFIVPDIDPLFIERKRFEESNLERLREDLHRRPLQILYGPYGSGKTSIVRQFVHEYANRYVHVFWLDADTASLDSSIRQTFEKELELRRAPRVSWLVCFEKKIKEYEQELDNHQRWLLVIDGCDNHQTTVNYAYVARLLARHGQTRHGHIILTMRSIPDDFKNRNLTQLRLIDTMHNELEEATFMLVRAALGKSDLRYSQENLEKLRNTISKNPQEQANYWESATALVHELYDNPGFINAAGVDMYENKRTPQDNLKTYRQQLQKFPQTVKNKASKELSRMMAVNSQNYSKLQASSPEDHALAVLMLCIFLNVGPIPRQVIDVRPTSTSHHPFYTSTLETDEDIRLLSTLHFLNNDASDSPAIHVLRVQKMMRDFIHRDDQFIDADQRKEYKRYAIHAISTAFLAHKEAIIENPAQYASYSPHISKCVYYLEDRIIIKYIQEKMPSMLKSIFEFLYAVGTYLQRHPEDESVHVVSEIFEKQRRVIPMRAARLFRLAMKIYDLWQASAGEEEPQPTVEVSVAEMLHVIALFFHESSLYWDQGGLNEAKDYYHKAVQYVHAPNTYSPIILHIEHDFGRLYSDLNEYNRAEDQFARALARLDCYATTPLTAEQRNEVSLWRAEILLSKAVNLTRQGYQNSDRVLYDQAQDIYKQVSTTLNELAADSKPARQIRERCQLDYLSLLLCESLWIDNALLQKEIEQCWNIIDQTTPDLDPDKNAPALTWLQMIVDLNNLAVAYCRLAQQKWRKNVYLKEAIKCAQHALNQHNKFKKLYPGRRRQGHRIWQTVWDNYCANPYYDKNARVTKDLWEDHNRWI